LDAKRVIESGCDGVIVSNHGGRNLDHAVATLDALPAVVEAVNGRGFVALDSGVRRGGDVLKALALGADFVFVGRATLYGLAAAGEPGVRRALQILGEELRRDMGFCGCTSVEDITRALIFGAAPQDAPAARRKAAAV
jgi:isopentenyl diphosphate isomerase/L-lactate dehydrogenase-like FMN-dependent dehydrogenase